MGTAAQSFGHHARDDVTMAALTATSWTCAVQTTRIENKQRITRVHCTLPTTGEYTTGGIPIPGREALGMVRNLEYIVPFAAEPGAARIWKYDPVNGSIRMYTASDGAELATTATAGAGSVIMYVEAVGW